MQILTRPPSLFDRISSTDQSRFRGTQASCISHRDGLARLRLNRMCAQAQRTACALVLFSRKRQLKRSYGEGMEARLKGRKRKGEIDVIGICVYVCTRVYVCKKEERQGGGSRFREVVGDDAR